MRRRALGAQLPAAAAAALALAVLALAGPPAGAAPLGARAPRLWLSMEGLFGEPGGDTSRGGGAGLRLGLRLTDQLSMAGGFTTLFARRGVVTGLAAGFEATLDA